MATVIDFPPVPRLHGVAQQDIRLLEQWATDYFQASGVRFTNVEARVDAASVLEELGDALAGIEELPGGAVLGDVITKVNEILAALQEQSAATTAKVNQIIDALKEET